MKTAVVPAQITTVEDKIAGSLGISQLLLLIAPVFGASILFVILPPFFTYAVYKVVVIVCVAVLCGILAIRVKGKIVLAWITALLRYNLRPRYYVLDKNDLYLRDVVPQYQPESADEEPEPQKIKAVSLPPLSTLDLVKVENILTNPEANFRLEVNRKGELSVHLKEIQ